MKKYYFICFIFCALMVSCSTDLENLGFDNYESAKREVKEDVSTILNEGDIIPLPPSPYEKPAKLRSSSSSDINSILYDLIDFPINIIVKENPRGVTFLTSKGLNQPLVFETEKNNESQKFYLAQMPLTGQWLIRTDVNNVKKFLSAGVYSNNPNKKVLYVKDGTSSFGAVWNFLKGQSDNESLIIENEDVIEQGSSGAWYDVYNCVIGADGADVYFDKYRNKRIQEFEIRPVDNFKLKSIEYINDETAYFEQIPNFEVRWHYTNNTSLKQTMSTGISEKTTRTSSFGNTTSISVNVNAEVTCGVPSLVSGKISTSVGSSTQFTYGKNESKEDTRNYNFPIEISPRTSITATVFVSRYELNVRYKAILEGEKTHKELKMEGLWKGIDFTEVNFTIEELNLDTNSTKKIYIMGVPKNTIQMWRYGNGELMIIPGKKEQENLGPNICP